MNLSEKLTDSQLYLLHDKLLIARHQPCGCSDPFCCVTGWQLRDELACRDVDDPLGIQLLVGPDGQLGRIQPGEQGANYVEVHGIGRSIDDLVAVPSDAGGAWYVVERTGDPNTRRGIRGPTSLADALRTLTSWQAGDRVTYLMSAEDAEQVILVWDEQDDPWSEPADPEAN